MSEIHRCPGCRAKCEVTNQVKSHPGDNPRVQVCCFLCDYRGPSRYTEEDAVYAHNAICRPAVPDDGKQAPDDGKGQPGTKISITAVKAAICRAAEYGWEHPNWEWKAVAGGLDRFFEQAFRQPIEGEDSMFAAPQGWQQGAEKLLEVMRIEQDRLFGIGEAETYGQAKGVRWCADNFEAFVKRHQEGK